MKSFRGMLMGLVVAASFSVAASAKAQSIVSSSADAAFAGRANPARI